MIKRAYVWLLLLNASVSFSATDCYDFPSLDSFDGFWVGGVAHYDLWELWEQTDYDHRQSYFLKKVEKEKFDGLRGMISCEETDQNVSESPASSTTGISVRRWVDSNEFIVIGVEDLGGNDEDYNDVVLIATKDSAPPGFLYSSVDNIYTRQPDLSETRVSIEDKWALVKTLLHNDGFNAENENELNFWSFRFVEGRIGYYRRYGYRYGYRYSYRYGYYRRPSARPAEARDQEE